MEYQNPLPLLKEYHFYPKKELGQNFLIDSHILSRIVDLAGVTEDLTVLEIGAGLGSLTFFLAQKARQVISVEVDRDLFPILQQMLRGFSNVTLLHADILTLDMHSLALPNEYIIVANIPYYITSAILRKLLSAEVKPAHMLLTVQEEVARRICAPAGQLSLLALSVQVFGRAEMVMKIPAGAFFPPPEVDSMTLRLHLFAHPLVPQEHLDAFFKLTKAGFSQKRKMLRNALSAAFHISPAQVEMLLKQANIDPQRRAQTLSIAEWQAATETFLPFLV